MLALRRITLLMLFTVVPLRVRVPAVADELPIVRLRVRVLSTLMAPIESAVLMLMPAVVADPAFWKSAVSAVPQPAVAVFGFQFVVVYQAEPAPVFCQVLTV